MLWKDINKVSFYCRGRTDNKTEICPDCGICEALDAAEIDKAEQDKIIAEIQKAAAGVQALHRLADRRHAQGRRDLRHRHRRQDFRPDRGRENGHQFRSEGRVFRRAHRLVLRHGVDRPR